MPALQNEISKFENELHEISVDDEQLDEISRLASLLIAPSDIALYLELDEKAFVFEISLPFTEISRAFRKGYLKTLITSREKLFQEIEMFEKEDAEMIIPEEKLAEISKLLEDYEAVIQTDINNA